MYTVLVVSFEGYTSSRTAKSREEANSIAAEYDNRQDIDELFIFSGEIVEHKTE